jgi:hypothetical protein
MVWWVDHIGLLVSDLAHAKNFYGACLAALGWQFGDYRTRGGVFRNANSPPLYLTPASTDARGLLLAFGASSRLEPFVVASVDLHELGLPDPSLDEPFS